MNNIVPKIKQKPSRSIRITTNKEEFFDKLDKVKELFNTSTYRATIEKLLDITLNNLNNYK